MSARWRPRDHLPSLLLFVAGLLLAVGIAELVRRHDRNLQATSLDRRATHIATAVKVSQVMWLEILHHLSSFFRSSDEVTRDDFHDFVRPALARHPEVAALEWFPLTPASAREALEARARADGLVAYRVRELGPDGTMVPARSRPEHLPLFYMEPMNDSAIGLDLYASELRRAPADLARDSGAAIVSPRLRLVEDPAGVWSVAVHMPIYRRGQPIATEDERRAAFAGVAVELFRLKATLDQALAGFELGNLEVALEDLSARGEERALYRTGLEPRGEPLVTLRPMLFAGREWALRFSVPVAGSMSVAAVLVGGTILAAVAALLLSAWRVILRQRRDLEAARSVGQYTLLERIGVGGMGEVYRARHALLRRPTAVKILARDRASEADLRRFEREVQITGRLTHPNTVVVFDYGHTPDGRFYYAMEYIDGITLERLIARFGPQPAGRVVHILEQACGALAEAHAAGLIHRDVKPANFMLCQRGGVPDFVKVLDFGMVKEGGMVSEVSDTGVSYGTPLYLAPEAIQDPRHVDQRADLYALGLVGYYLLSGQRAIRGDTLAEVMHQHLAVIPHRPSEVLGAPVPPGLEAVIMSCLAKDPADRPASALELRRALLELDDVPPWSPEVAAAWWSSKKAELSQVAFPAEEERQMDVAMSER